jgi:exopolyphosphatase/guanosine-5'-triphosphate,3'-diphosphate pyrophosphatase
MIVADASRRDGHLEVVDRVKEMVRLGRRSFMTGRLTDESMDLAIGALKNFGRLARVRKVDRLRAVATSAVREAKNRVAAASNWSWSRIGIRCGCTARSWESPG